ncbi:hypothetical protein J6590_010384 [Homalodisca vitripennis]|nr:hypothetical protein J6590_010384 [Homalodisca vitripennis]
MPQSTLGYDCWSWWGLFPTSEVLVSLNKGVPPPAYFDWKGWFRADLPFFRANMTLRCSALILPHGSL